ncbi:FtsB family cell division protein [Mogibacterium timidum]|uniref:FtsB family cell division protein n=1 Tax=Mogibacterium timidum TaxID=35519 RepID=UPI00248D1A14|nr:septum formation initiator family protein [Mogibacterium timidum]
MSRSNRREVRSSDGVAGAAQEAGSRAGSKKNKKNKKRRLSAMLSKPKNRRNLIISAVVLLLFAASVRNIIKLELENRRLTLKNRELKETKKELQIELKNVNSKEYIEEQARKQLRLVNPDEILFVFPNDKDKSNGESGGK